MRTSHASARRRLLRGGVLGATLIVTLALAGCGEYTPLDTDDDGPLTSQQRADGDSATGGTGTTKPVNPPSTPTPPPVAAPQTPVAPIVDQGGGDSGGGSEGSGGGSSGSGGPSWSGGSGGSGGSGSGSADGGDPGSPPPIPQTYPFALPPSDPSVFGSNGPMYLALLWGCDYALALSSSPNGLIDEQIFWGLTNPRLGAMYTSAVVLTCGLNETRSRAIFDVVIGLYGLTGMDKEDAPRAPDGSDAPPVSHEPGYGEPECDLYRSLQGHFYNVDPETLACYDEDAPDAHFFDYDARDDPCTLAQETAPAPTNYADWVAASQCFAAFTEAMSGITPAILPPIMDGILNSEGCINITESAPPPGTACTTPEDAVTAARPEEITEAIASEVEAASDDAADASPATDAEAPVGAELEVARSETDGATDAAADGAESSALLKDPGVAEIATLSPDAAPAESATEESAPADTEVVADQSQAGD